MYTKRLNLQKHKNHYQNKVNKCPSRYIETNYKKNILNYIISRYKSIFQLKNKASISHSDFSPF